MKKIILIVIGLVIVGGSFFYGGIKYDQNKTTANRQARFTAGVGNFVGRNGVAGTGGMRNGGATSGEVLAKDDKSKTRNEFKCFNHYGSETRYFDCSDKCYKI